MGKRLALLASLALLFPYSGNTGEMLFEPSTSARSTPKPTFFQKTPPLLPLNPLLLGRNTISWGPKFPFWFTLFETASWASSAQAMAVFEQGVQVWLAQNAPITRDPELHGLAQSIQAALLSGRTHQDDHVYRSMVGHYTELLEKMTQRFPGSITPDHLQKTQAYKASLAQSDKQAQVGSYHAMTQSYMNQLHGSAPQDVRDRVAELLNKSNDLRSGAFTTAGLSAADASYRKLMKAYGISMEPNPNNIVQRLIDDLHELNQKKNWMSAVDCNPEPPSSGVNPVGSPPPFGFIRATKNDRIEFYHHDPHQCEGEAKSENSWLGNFHVVPPPGIQVPWGTFHTTEAAFQAAKCPWLYPTTADMPLRKACLDEFQNALDGEAAFHVSKKHKFKNPSAALDHWIVGKGRDNAMKAALAAKFSAAHPQLRASLCGTGNTPLWETIPNGRSADKGATYWGTTPGPPATGENKLGQYLEEVRAETCAVHHNVPVTTSGSGSSSDSAPVVSESPEEIRERMAKNREARRKLLEAQKRMKANREERRRRLAAELSITELSLRRSESQVKPPRSLSFTDREISAALGLPNQGNTCFANSALKVLMNMPNVLGVIQSQKTKRPGESDQDFRERTEVVKNLEKVMKILKARESGLKTKAGVPQNQELLYDSLLDFYIAYNTYFLDRSGGLGGRKVTRDQADSSNFLTSILDLLNFSTIQRKVYDSRRNGGVLPPRDMPAISVAGNSSIQSQLERSELIAGNPNSVEHLTILRGISGATNEIEHTVNLKLNKGSKDEHTVPMRLTTVTEHLGASKDFGHYISYVYDRAENAWFKHDDSMVTRLSPSELAIAQQKWKTKANVFLYTRDP